MGKDIEEARTWFENFRKELHPSNTSITEHGLEMIAEILYTKKVGRWDELMNDAEVEAKTKEDSKLNDVANLVAGYGSRLVDVALNFETKHTTLDIIKITYQVTSQIFKTLRVEMDKADASNA